MSNFMRRKQCYLLSVLICICLFVGSLWRPGISVDASDTTVSTLLFTSDVHTKTEHLTSWLDRTVAIGISKPDYVCFGGDFASSFSLDDLTAVQEIVEEHYPNSPVIYTTGNHEAKDLDEEAFESAYGYASTDYAVYEDDYILYTFGATTSKQCFEKAEIKKLKKFLASLTEEQKKHPVIILSHYPIHCCKSRTTTNAATLLALLNQYPNVVFLYGHNHTKSDSMYGTVQKAGDQLELDEDTTQTIQFTYGALGSMKEGAKQGAYGLVLRVYTTNDSSYITLRYRNLKKYIDSAVKISISK